ncbi:MAG: hypothetical protein WBA46_06605, partial [Thermomicrobiales bacterium]
PEPATTDAPRPPSLLKDSSMPHAAAPTALAPILPEQRLAIALDIAASGPRIVARTEAPDAPAFVYGTSVQHILVPLESGSLRQIEALDVLEHALDEQAFIAECARLLGEGGRLRLRVPVDGASGWLDAINLMRYVAETTGLAPEPEEPKPIGWHRHYRPRDLVRLISDAGFDVSATRKTNPGITEIPHAAGLLVGQGLLKRAGTERSLGRLRQRLAPFENALPAGPFGTRLTITAWRT